MSEIKVLEHPTLKVPYETLNRKFRNAQKTVDREVSHVNAVALELENTLRMDSSTETVALLLDSMVEKLNVLKRKAEESMDEEIDAANLCKRRLSHLKEYELLSPLAQQIWKKKRVDRMLVEYCLRHGYYETALELADYSDIKDLTNVDIFLQSKQIEESLLQHQIGPCLAWCHENKSKLRKAQSTLEFHLRQQEFIELVRQGRRLEAVKHSRKHLSNVDPAQLEAVQRMMALLAFKADTHVSPYKEMFSEQCWTDLVAQFRKENFTLHQLSCNSVFLVTLQCGLSALKTPHCYRIDSKNNNCPVCSKHLNELAKHLPSSHCANSKLVCSLSGDLLNENNPPMVLPNGHVYGTKGLSAMASVNEGQVLCPRTQQVFRLEQAEKVYIM